MFKAMFHSSLSINKHVKFNEMQCMENTKITLAEILKSKTKQYRNNHKRNNFSYSKIVAFKIHEQISHLRQQIKYPMD